MLDIVNKYFPDILPEEVLKHYGYSSRPAGELGKSALYSASDTFVDVDFNQFEKLNDENILLKAENAELKRHLNTEERQAFMPAARFFLLKYLSGVKNIFRVKCFLYTAHKLNSRGVKRPL